ncbi:hypothetical protein [Lentzea tibetensis]|uniref:hypothetical protein n=1 Tax=Lentzea tibetensis TaxID=2591470 RepID=UPI0016454EBF|nr:hypothetical protein [Lentzea tibetensis]
MLHRPSAARARRHARLGRPGTRATPLRALRDLTTARLTWPRLRGLPSRGEPDECAAVELTWPDGQKAKRDVSEDFLRLLRSAKAQKRFGELGFRDPSHASGLLATDDNGVPPGFQVKELQTPAPTAAATTACCRRPAR